MGGRAPAHQRAPTGCGSVWFRAPRWGRGGRWFESGQPDFGTRLRVEGRVALPSPQGETPVRLADRRRRSWPTRPWRVVAIAATGGKKRVGASGA